MREWTAGLIAGKLGLPLRGNANRRIETAAPLDLAGQEELSFIGSEKLFEAGRASQAGCLIAPPHFDAMPEQTVIASPQPRAYAYNSLASWWA